MKNKSKHQKIIEDLESGKTITSWEAIKEYNVTRLAAIIFNLKKDGMKIESKDYTEKNGYGDTVKYTRYKCLNIIEDRDQLDMFSNKPKEFKRWLDAPPVFDKKKHIR